MKIFIGVASLIAFSCGFYFFPASFVPQDDHDDEEREEGRVTLTDKQRAASGIEVVVCGRRTLPEIIRTTGTVQVNADEVSHLGSPVAGFVEEIKPAGFLGAHVDEGDPLVKISSLEFGKLQTEYRRAMAIRNLREKNHDLEKRLNERRISSGRELLEAETALEEAKISLEAARNQLEILGLGKAELARLEEGGAPLGMLLLRASIHGKIIDKHIVRGEHVDTESDLFTITNLHKLWVIADIYDRDISRVARKQTAEVLAGSYPGLAFRGEITHVSDTLDTKTRTLKVRVETENEDLKLKPGMFVTVKIAVGKRENVLVVPEAALQGYRKETIVFVEEERNVFEPRMIRPGVRFGGYVEVLRGIEEGDKVVTSGGFLLKSELEKDSFGGGHAH